MRVLHVTDTFLPKIGGAEIALDQLTRGMNALETMEVSVLAQVNRGISPTLDVPYPVHRFSRPRTNLFAGWWIVRHIKRLHRQKPFDVIIGHHAFAPGYACVKFGQMAGIPSIV